MALDREATLKKAEKLLRQGRLDAAIAEYLLVVEDQPRDWNTANTLGDLYVRAGQTQKALAQYVRIAQHFAHEGFYPKAAALYKKSLKISPDDESIQLELAEISTKQGLLADAKAHLAAVAARRRARGDWRGASDIVVRLGLLDPSDFEARLLAAKELEQIGDTTAASERFRVLYADLLEKGRTTEALDALREAVRLNPDDRASRAILARTAIQSGDLESAAAFIDRESAGDDPVLLSALIELELRSDRLDAARDLLVRALGSDRDRRHQFLTLGWSLCGTKPDAAFVCVDAVVDVAAAMGNFDEAATALTEFATRVPHHIPALLKFVEVCVDGGLEPTMYQAQMLLADAYLEAGQAAEARVIAEDLVAREPAEPAHIERYRRALVMLGVPDPDAVIAERVSSAAPEAPSESFDDLGLDVSGPLEPVVVPSDPEPRSEVAGPQPPPGVLPPPPPIAQPAPPPATAPMASPGTVPTTAVADDRTVPASSKLAQDRVRTHDEAHEIDLTDVLGDLKTPTVAAPERPAPENLDQVFEDKRAEVVATPEADQSTQYIQLANTYLELDMVDEAISALETAVRSPRQRFAAASVLGRLHMRRGAHAVAIEWLERAAEAPAPSVEEAHALLYDLGVLLDEAGETARALALFLELQAEADDYRDVAVRIDRLTRVQTGG